LRVFLDTNVLVSAFATRGLCADLLELVLLQHEFIVSRSLLRELERALRLKVKVPARDAVAISDFLADQAAHLLESSRPAAAGGHAEVPVTPRFLCSGVMQIFGSFHRARFGRCSRTRSRVDHQGFDIGVPTASRADPRAAGRPNAVALKSEVRLYGLELVAVRTARPVCLHDLRDGCAGKPRYSALSES